MVARNVGYIDEKTGYTPDKNQRLGYKDNLSSDLGVGNSLSQTEIACESFLSELKKISGVIDVQVEEDCATSELVIYVTIGDFLSASTWEVSKLRSRTLRMFPDAQLEINLDEQDTE